MANKVFIGNAAFKIDTWTFVPAALGAPPTNNFFTIICNGKSVTFTCGAADTAATVVLGLYNLLTATDITAPPPEFQEYTWTQDGVNKLTATAKTAGQPGTFTEAHGNGGGAGAPTFTMVNTVAGTGPNDAANTANWTSGTLPVGTDSIFVDSQSPAILWNLNVLSGVAITLTEIDNNFTNTIGLPVINPAGYREYRPTSFRCETATLKVGLGAGSGSSRIRINLAGANCAVQLFNTAGSADQGIQALQITGSGTNTLDITGGSIDLAPYAGDAMAMTTVKQSGGTIHASSAVTVSGNINQSGGSATLDGGFSAALTMTGGTLRAAAASNATTITVQNATFTDARTGGTTTSGIIGIGGVIDKSQDISAVTYTDLQLNGGTLIDPAKVITVTNGITRGTAIKQLSSQ